MTSAGRHPQEGGGAVDNVLREVAADAIRRISRRSPAWWRTETAGAATRADVIERLVGDLAELGQRAEKISEPRRPARPARESALVDQLAVVTYDLLAAAPHDTAEATAFTVLALYEVDPRPVAASALDQALAARLDGALRERLERLPRAGDL